MRNKEIDLFILSYYEKRTTEFAKTNNVEF